LYINISQRYTLDTIKRRKDNWICYILRRNCLLKEILEGKTKRGIEVMGRHGRRSKQLLVDLKETRGCWKLNEEALDCILLGTGFGRGCGLVVRQTSD
jgi:hypothetical protein